MKVYCPGLLSGKYVPARYTSQDMPGGMNISPQIAWGEVSPEARSFVLTIIDESDGADQLVHWLVINIPPQVREIPERSSRIRDRMPAGSMELRNGSGEVGYSGPYILRGSGLHSFRVTVYGISEETLEFGPLSMLGDVLLEIENKIVDSGSTTALLRQ